MEQHIMPKEVFVDKMNRALFAYKVIGDDSKELLEIIKCLRKSFPNKIEELSSYMFELDFGKCGDEFKTPEDFYDELVA